MCCRVQYDGSCRAWGAAAMKHPLPDYRQIGWQMYRFLDFVGHWLASGEYVELVRYEALCASCGRPFRSKATKTNWRRSRLSRRCEIHRRAGREVLNNFKPPIAYSRMPGWAKPDKSAIRVTGERKRYALSPSQRKPRKSARLITVIPFRPSYLD